MSILLDTHVWIWSQESPQEIGPVARECLENREHAIFVSSVSSRSPHLRSPGCEPQAS